MSSADIVRQYHERSKHHLDRYAPGPDGLDWATQPEPFRHFAGTPILDLPLLSGELPVRWEDLYEPSGVASQVPSVETLAQLLELSLGLSAWKSWGGNRWGLRCNPSSGNLHPTEAYLICPEMPGLPAGVHHYRPDRHCLEQRAAAPFGWSGGVLVALTGIHWREAWKYGMRAFRYCQHDAGHALAALAYSAALLGWSVRRLSECNEWGDHEIAALCGLDRPEDFPPGDGETPEGLLWIGPAVGNTSPPAASAVLATLECAGWAGRANVLSPTHRDWPDIPVVAAATKVPGALSGQPAVWRSDESHRLRPSDVSSLATVSASALIRRRRSAQEFDGVTAMRKTHFLRLLAALLPGRGAPPWALLDTAPAVHPVLFVHRVSGVESGIYCLPRAAEALAELRSAMRPDWLWEPVAAAGDLPLFLLAPLDARGFAATASCHQEIAADSAFMVAMLARFDDFDAQPWCYRERFVEAGILGQVLYLEAEAGDLQGTGIGCYFDDLVHRTLGLDTTRFQDVYQFTVGQALLDTRLGSEPGYAALATER